MDIIKIKTLRVSQDNIKKVERKSSEWEKIFANQMSDKSLVSKYIKHSNRSTPKYRLCN